MEPANTLVRIRRLGVEGNHFDKSRVLDISWLVSLSVVNCLLLLSYRQARRSAYSIVVMIKSPIPEIHVNGKTSSSGFFDHGTNASIRT